VLPKIPALGLVGEAALREAFAGDYAQLQQILVGELRKAFKLAGDTDPWPYVRALFADRIVVERDGRYWSYTYAVDGTKVTLSPAVEVVLSFKPTSEMREAAAQGVFIEAKAPGKFLIRVCKAGASLNGNYYPDAVLREAAPMFDGARVFVKSDEVHLAGKGKDVRNLIGGLSGAKFVEGNAGVDSGEIQATLTMLQPEGPESVKLREAWQNGMASLFGFSIDAKGVAKPGNKGGRAVKVATKFVEVKSVDLIVEPGAGGQVIGLVEAKKEQVMDRDAIIALIESKRPELLKGKDKAALTNEELETILREAVAASPAPANQPQNQPAAMTPEQVAEMVRMVEARSHARGAIAQSGLPEAAKTRLTKRFQELTTFREADVDVAIKDEKAYVATFTESGKVALGDFPEIKAGESRAEKTSNMLDAFFDPTHKEHRHARSFRECYISITGDRRVTGRMDNCDEALLREALGVADFRESLLSTSWANVLGNSITRRMVNDYRLEDLYSVWRRICYVTPVSDFRTQERTRFGGYTDLQPVGEGDPYLPMASPTDEKATYAVTKRGGTEDITLEMIKNDDVRSIQQIPIKLSRAAKRTLSKFVFDFIRTNPVIYDGIAFFHATHNNLGSSAFDATSLAAARLNMLKQTELSSADRLGIPPRMLLFPWDLQEAAFNVFQRGTENDKKFIASMLLDLIPVWYWTDTNDWALMADPNEATAIEIGFLDGNEEPELFVQDNPTVGSMFSNDKLTWKMRHVYGGNAVDFRGAFKAVL
jgi:hypothetical protein